MNEMVMKRGRGGPPPQGQGQPGQEATDQGQANN